MENKLNKETQPWLLRLQKKKKKFTNLSKLISVAKSSPSLCFDLSEKRAITLRIYFNAGKIICFRFVNFTFAAKRLPTRHRMVA